MNLARQLLNSNEAVRIEAAQAASVFYSGELVGCQWLDFRVRPSRDLWGCSAGACWRSDMEASKCCLISWVLLEERER